MKKRCIATLLITLMVLQTLLPAMAQLGVPPPPTPPDTIHDQFDTGSVLASPLLFYMLQKDEERHPEKVYLRVDDMRFQSAVSTSGNLSGVAQYQPLDTGVKTDKLYYQRDYLNQSFQLLGSYDGYNSMRLEANLAAPSRYHLKVSDTRVFHRLDAPFKVDFNVAPASEYDRTWQRTKADGDVALNKNGDVFLYGGLQVDKRQGVQAHTFYEIHKFNCTDCHTLGFGQNVNYRTDDWYGGARARLPWPGSVADVKFRSSVFENQGPNYAWNLGGPYGVSTLFPTSGSKDRIQEYQTYFGATDQQWRAGAHVYVIDRTNSASGQTRNGQYVSGQAGGYIGNNLALTASYYSQNEDNSLATDLSNAKQRLTLQAAWNPLRTLNVTGRGGIQNSQYRILGSTAPDMHDAWFELRTDWRPIKQMHITAKYRNDNVDHPYFPTDFARKAQTDVQASYATSDMTAGVEYDHIYGSNTINAYEQSDFLAFITARMMKRYMFNASYANTSINANVAQNFFLPMPQATAAAITPGIGGPLFLQSGLPYAAHNQYLQASLVVPFGPKNPITLTPTYRWVRSDTSANYLPLFPAVPLDSATHIVQSVFGVRVDMPVFGPTERLGLGWERDQWTANGPPNRTGSFDLFMLNFSKRY